MIDVLHEPLKGKEKKARTWTCPDFVDTLLCC
jgi:hypothetical protein